MTHRFNSLYLAAVCCLLFAGVRTAAADAKQDLANAREDVIRYTRSYTEQLSRLLELEQAASVRAAEALETRRALFRQGLISRVEFNESEAQLQNIDRRVQQMRRQIADAERTIAEVKLALEEDSRTPEEDSGIIRFAGRSPWSLQSVTRIESFFVLHFGGNLPLSAYGQTPLHDRFGLAHQNAIDVAVHPDSPEGQALIKFLRESGTSFIAFRSAVAGSATGAHIHIGPPSQRTRAAT